MLLCIQICSRPAGQSTTPVRGDQHPLIRYHPLLPHRTYNVTTLASTQNNERMGQLLAKIFISTSISLLESTECMH
jgi:hypothetical protein